MAEKAQRKHNPKTRGYNTKYKGTVWGEVQRTIGKGRNKREITEKVVVPYDKQWDPSMLEHPENLPYPYDLLTLDWMEEVVHYALDNNAKVKKEFDEKTGLFTYRVISRERGLVFEVTSSRNVMFNPNLRRKKRQ